MHNNVGLNEYHVYIKYCKKEINVFISFAFPLRSLELICIMMARMNFFPLVLKLNFCYE